MNTTKEKIRAVKSQIKIAVKQYNQAERALTRLVKTLDQLEKKNVDARNRTKSV
jgi:predicted  nucleic acid-binding Zn-ribbon protein